MPTLLKIFAFILGLCGLIMLFGTLGNIEMIQEELVGWLMLVFLANVLPIGASIFLYRKGIKMEKDLNYRKYEAMVLDLVQEKGGTLTIADVTVNTSMTYKEADSFLKEMYVHGVLGMDTNGEGQIEYFLNA
ncbi:MAG: hypothetical protein R8G66_29345 [Cytophagales bacterium]|nr:hypothetical protein [Cytophagales bacterium]